MAYPLCAKVVVLLLITVLAPIGQAFAVPVTYDYQFISGALTGGFRASFDKDPDMFFQFGIFQSWNFSAPTGFGTIVWDSMDPQQLQFDNALLVNTTLLALTYSPAFPFGGSPAISVNADGIWPDGVSGNYDFRFYGADVQVFGSGQWARLAVREPNTRWSFVFGLLALTVVHWLRRAPSSP